MSIHDKIIMEATGCSEEMAGKLAEIMQEIILKSSFDWISKDELTAAAKEAAILYHKSLNQELNNQLKLKQ